MSFDRLISFLSIVAFVAGSSFYQPIPKLLGTNSFHSSQGTSVALSKAGNLIISGGPTSQNSFGGVWIFNRTSEGFKQIQQLLPFNYSTNTPKFGSSVTISNSENFIVVGGDEGGPETSGAVWVFIQHQDQRNFYLPQSKIIGSDQIGESKQGTSVAISSEGRVLAIGGPGDNGNIGAVWAFTWSIDATSWLQMGDKLVGSDIDHVAKFGWSIDLSSEGDILAIGGPLDAGNLGAAWIFVYDQVNQIWTQQGPKLIGNNGGRLHAEQGTSVALSSSGTILAVGGPYDDNFRGGVWIFNRNEDTQVWFQSCPMIRGTGATITAVMMGSSVDLSSTGDILIFGGSNDYPYGALWAFQKDNQTNTYNQLNKLTGDDTQDGDVDLNIGYSLSVSDNGLMIITGAPSDDNGTGAVWVFTVNLDDEEEKNPTLIIILVILVTVIIFVVIYLYITKNSRARPFTQLRDVQPLNLGPDNSTHPTSDLNNSEHPTKNSSSIQ